MLLPLIAVAAFANAATSDYCDAAASYYCNGFGEWVRVEGDTEVAYATLIEARTQGATATERARAAKRAEEIAATHAHQARVLAAGLDFYGVNPFNADDRWLVMRAGTPEAAAFIAEHSA